MRSHYAAAGRLYTAGVRTREMGFVARGANLWGYGDMPHHGFAVRRWCNDVEAKTRQDPVGGGGHGPRYTWTQTPAEVTVSFEVRRIEREGGWAVRVGRGEQLPPPQGLPD